MPFGIRLEKVYFRLKTKYEGQKLSIIMKKFSFLSILMVVFLFSSCSTSKLAKQTTKSFRGDWTLSKITNEKGNHVNIKNIFAHSSLSCFEGSDWHLVANNESGHYTLQGAGCPVTQNKIKWFMSEEDGNVYFWFKRLEEGVKAKKTTKGYKMRVVSVDETQAHLIHEVPFEGGKLALHYYFTKK